MWGATGQFGRFGGKLTISIHAPRVGSDLLVTFLRFLVIRFQSTLPVWGATWVNLVNSCAHSISIHAPRVGSDLWQIIKIGTGRLFQSTLPVWGATSLWHGRQYGVPDFNPRSPCGERPMSMRSRTPLNQFQSTLPVWGATFIVHLGYDGETFQSTLPVWGAT